MKRGDPDRAAARLRETVRALVRRFSVAERADVACCGMTVAQAATLEALQGGGPTRLGELGRRLGISPSTLTRNLTRLTDRGLVRSADDPEDRRAATVQLTPAGLRAADEVARQGEAFFALVLAQLPDRRRAATLAALEDLWAAVRSATEHCCPGAFDHLMEDTYPAERRSVTNGCTNC